LENNKVLSLLGLAMRGRNLVSGEFQTENAVKKGSAMLVIVAEDASDNTKKLFHDKCSYYEVPVYEYGSRDSLGKAIGKDLRSSVGVCDAGLANAIIKLLEMR
jgi:ribosomal protein L7Ae-like RNA K-turn-binding protein